MVDSFQFVAKWDEEGHSHPLLYHLIESGCVAAALWQHGLTEGARRQFSEWLGLKPEDAGHVMAFWVALHDLGKATPSFQGRCRPAKEALEGSGLSFPAAGEFTRPHALLTAWILERHLPQLALEPKAAVKQLLLALGGHHGVFPTNVSVEETAYRKVNLGNEDWYAVQDALFDQIYRLFAPPNGAHLKDGEAEANGFFNCFTGLVITCDWIASNTGSHYFPYCPANDSPEAYFKKSQEKAVQALRYAGWMGWQPASTRPVFSELFPAYAPNPIQQAIFAQLETLQDPFLMVVEAPTGGGKTEAALFTAETWMRRQHLRGFYIAMPTQATSNQMFDRVKTYLELTYAQSGESLNLQLTHSNAGLKDEFLKMQLAGIVDDDTQPASGVNALSWFTSKKLGLLATFGVGTVDQAFLSVLQARHFALRAFGLFRKVVIFDEVHAYDVYMVEIFKRLLPWLRAIGTSVILLSATLPSSTRKELLEAFDPQAEWQSREASFPRLSLNSGREIRTLGLGEVENRTVALKTIDSRPESILDTLRESLAQGGCAAVICNTVARAQTVYRALIDSQAFDPQEVTLFHSRFPFCRREEREDMVKRLYGKLEQPAAQPRRGVVVATQVIEQSLDLDFDLLISDLAPIDLLIQRIGRLQRHTHQNYPPLRPAALSQPTCVVALPAVDAQGMPVFEADAFVYDAVFLQRTYFALQGKSCLCLPLESDALINLVYSDGALAGLSDEQAQALHAAFMKMKKEAAKMSLSADNRLIPDVDYSRLLGSTQTDLDEENPTVHQDLRAITRVARPSVTLICLEQDAAGQVCLLDEHTPIDLTQAPTAELCKHALRSAVTTSDWRVVNTIQNDLPFKAWKKTAALRYSYPIIFDSLTHVARVGETFLTLDPALGLTISKNSSIDCSHGG